ncbi:MAG: DUF58 domain-containing protein, partial [Verrucomicrobiota bacterium]
MDQPVPTHPQETLRRAQRVEIVAARAVNDAMVGAYLSRFKGRGTDFEELREYVPGDDVRAMDWNVTARTGRPFIRLHREERELTMVLAVDVSGSADFGSGARTLRERAADVAACLAVSALKAGDKVGLLLFTDREELWLPPRKGRRQVLRIVREALEFRPASRRTSFAGPMRRLARAFAGVDELEAGRVVAGVELAEGGGHRILAFRAGEEVRQHEDHRAPLERAG